MLKERRERRRTRYLDAAIGIVVRGGLDALTMQAIASEVGAAVGTIYGYFPSKSALLVELQMMAVDRITTAWKAIAPLWRAEMASRASGPDEVTLGMVAAFGEFLLELERVYPREVQLQQLQLSETHQLFDPAEIDRLLPAAIGLFQMPYELVADAATAGLLDESATAAERSLAMAMALNGVTLTHNIQVLTDIVPVAGMVRMVLAALLIGWGAPRATVEPAVLLAAEVARAVPLPAPEVIDPDE